MLVKQWNRGHPTIDGCEILHQLMAYPIIYRVSIIPLVVQDFFHPLVNIQKTIEHGH
jgi:hypothetical protein